MSSEEPESSRVCGGGSCVNADTIGYSYALAEPPLRLGSISFFFLLFLERRVVGGMKW